jgi:hypothetical protein
MAWPLEGIFSATELEQAKFFDACGQAIDRPLLINEHPIFIEFADNAVSPNLQKAYSLATPDITHLSSPTHQSISNKEGSWLGALMLRAERQAQDIETIGTLRPSVLPTLEETAVLRDARNRIWNVSRHKNPNAGRLLRTG